jgi:hypothetical protein
MKKIIVIFFFLSLGISANVYSAELEFIFDWSDLKKCTSGNPNRVTNPIFYLNNIPDNTKYIQFRLQDKNVPSYSHGGGKVDISEIKVIKEKETNFGKYEFIIEPGKFKYKSPCPPGGKHTYEWTALAKNEKKKTIGEKAKSKQKYP